MCNITTSILKTIENILMNDTRLSNRFSIQIRKDKQYTTGTTNIYPKDNQWMSVFTDIIKVVDEYFTNTKTFYGEMIRIDVKNGYNVDIGMKQVDIIAGVYYETYCYTCFSSAFVRIWIEKGIAVSKNKIWISIDIDENINSIWFTD